MKTVWKFELPIKDKVEIEMPCGAQILCVDIQRNKLPPLPITIWALVDPAKSNEKVTFRIAGTGHGIYSPDYSEYIGTVLMENDRLVFHVFKSN